MKNSTAKMLLHTNSSMVAKLFSIRNHEKLLAEKINGLILYFFIIIKSFAFLPEATLIYTRVKCFLKNYITQFFIVFLSIERKKSLIIFLRCFRFIETYFFRKLYCCQQAVYSKKFLWYV